jgi:hypothetical protein
MSSLPDRLADRYPDTNLLMIYPAEPRQQS